MVAVANFGQISSCLSAMQHCVTVTFLNVSSLCMDVFGLVAHHIVVHL